MRTRQYLVAGLATVAGCLALPSLAGANVYCVDVSGGDCTHPEPAGAFQQALTDAAANPGPDTVRLGPVTYTGNAGAATAFTSAVGDGSAVFLVGSGQSGPTQTTITKPAVAAVQNTVLDFSGAGAGSVISDLRIEIPAPVSTEQYRGLQAAGNGGDLQRVTVNASTAFNGFGVIFSFGVVSDTTISLPRNALQGSTALDRSSTTPGDTLIQRSTLTAEGPLVHQNADTGNLTVRRSVLRGDATNSGALDFRGGTGTIESSVIDMSDFGGRAITVGNPNHFGTDTSNLTVDGVTAVGAGSGSGGIGVVASAEDPGATIDDNVSVSIRSTILDQFDIAIRRRADEGDTANVSIDYSNYPFGTMEEDNNPNGMGGVGMGSISEGGNRTDVDPMFVNAAMGDFHLQATSPLIELGDPTAPPVGATDLDGEGRALDASFDCSFVQRRDVGADEFAGATQGVPAACLPPPAQPLAPATPSTTPTPPRKKCKKRKRKSRVADAAKKWKRCKR